MGIMNNAIEAIQALALDCGLRAVVAGEQSAPATGPETAMALYDPNSPDPCTDNKCSHGLGSNCRRGVRDNDRWFRLLLRIDVPSEGTAVWYNVRGKPLKRRKYELADPKDFLALRRVFRRVVLQNARILLVS